jgi:hypothetical protein
MRWPFIFNTGKDSEGLARYSSTEYDGEHQLRVLLAFRLRVGSAAMGMRAGLSPWAYLSDQLPLKVICRTYWAGRDGQQSRTAGGWFYVGTKL